MDPRPPILVYRALMESIKGRVGTLRRLADGSVSLGDDRANWEWAALQLRMVLEAVAFASLAAHRDAYSSVHAKWATQWRAKQMLRDLAVIHPDFYPQPIRLGGIGTSGGVVLSPVDGFLTQDEFVELYEACSQIIHTHNPFGDLRPIDVRLSLGEWISRIQALLDTHVVRMCGSDERWVVQMAAGPDGGVQVGVAVPKPAV